MSTAGMKYTYGPVQSKVFNWGFSVDTGTPDIIPNAVASVEGLRRSWYIPAAPFGQGAIIYQVSFLAEGKNASPTSTVTVQTNTSGSFVALLDAAFDTATVTDGTRAFGTLVSTDSGEIPGTYVAPGSEVKTLLVAGSLTTTNYYDHWSLQIDYSMVSTRIMGADPT